MNSTPTHSVSADDALLALSKLAQDTDQDTQDVFTMYALEGLLARIAGSPYRDDFVLKGSVLLAVFGDRQPFRDIDTRASGISSDPDSVIQRFREIIAADLDDGLIFDQDPIRASIIQENGENKGVRLRLQVRLGTTYLFAGVNVTFDEPIWPAPQTITVPSLANLGREPLKLLGYPLAMVIAEKTVTMIQRGKTNIRWRDFADIFTLSRCHDFTTQILRQSILTTATHRTVVLTPLLLTLSGLPDETQEKWAAWQEREERPDLPASFNEVLQAIAAFIDPVLNATGDTIEDQIWNPKDQTWR